MNTYIGRDGQRLGPLEDAQIESGLQAGTLLPEDLAWREGMAAWQPLRTLYPTAGVPPPLPPGVQPPPRLGDDAGVRLLLPVGRSGWAIAAGYLGLFGLIVLPAPLALLVSIIAIRDIRRSRSTPTPKYGMGRAVFGLIIGILGTLVLALVLVGKILGHHAR